MESQWPLILRVFLWDIAGIYWAPNEGPILGAPGKPAWLIMGYFPWDMGYFRVKWPLQETPESWNMDVV